MMRVPVGAVGAAPLFAGDAEAVTEAMVRMGTGIGHGALAKAGLNTGVALVARAKGLAEIVPGIHGAPAGGGWVVDAAGGGSLSMTFSMLGARAPAVTPALAAVACWRSRGPVCPSFGCNALASTCALPSSVPPTALNCFELPPVSARPPVDAHIDAPHTHTRTHAPHVHRVLVCLLEPLGNC